ncbi:MAG: DUF4437 domain-containing protein [Myxococcota bacterium]
MSALLASSLAVGCSKTSALPTPYARSTEATVLLSSDVQWEALNPARGDQSPMAGTLWGDRNGTEATGFLLKPVDGFESPPHIHNVTYRGVVLRGLLHNDDPDAAVQWMPAGSFWTQPKGQVHITSAKGADVLAYIEIDEGPYLVKPVEAAFSTEEVPINVDRSNLVWLSALDRTAMGPMPKVAYLWGQPEDEHPSGSLLRFPAGFEGSILTDGPAFRAVVLQGQPVLGEVEAIGLELGSTFHSKGPSLHHVSCRSSEDCSFYLRVEGGFTVQIGQNPQGNGASL